MGFKWSEVQILSPRLSGTRTALWPVQVTGRASRIQWLVFLVCRVRMSSILGFSSIAWSRQWAGGPLRDGLRCSHG